MYDDECESNNFNDDRYGIIRSNDECEQDYTFNEENNL
jgi:hypothetical protein